MAELFEGFYYPVRIDNARGRVREETDYEHYVSQLIKQVLLTAPGERVDRPDFGAGLRQMVFSPASEESATLLQAVVFQCLERWLGNLIEVNEVVTAFDDGRLDVNVVYTLKSRGDQQVLNLEVTL